VPIARQRPTLTVMQSMIPLAEGNVAARSVERASLLEHHTLGAPGLQRGVLAWPVYPRLRSTLLIRKAPAPALEREATWVSSR
jgi:hypothetical protein